MSNFVVVLGASGRVGSAVVRECVNLSLKVFAGVRDLTSEKAKALMCPNVTLFRYDCSKPETFENIPKGPRCVFVNIPDIQERTKLGMNSIDAAKNAGAKHIVLLSVSIADDPSSIFGGQFIPIEKHLAGSGLPFTILRLPMFMETLCMDESAIVEKGELCCPTGPDSKGSGIALSDVGVAFAHVLANPSKHNGKTYDIAAKPYSTHEAAKHFSIALGKPVKFVRQSYEEARKSFLDLGFPDWEADGMLEICHAIDDGKFDYYSKHRDFARIVGHEPLTVEQWVMEIGAPSLKK